MDGQTHPEVPLCRSRSSAFAFSLTDLPSRSTTKLLCGEANLCTSEKRSLQANASFKQTMDFARIFMSHARSIQLEAQMRKSRDNKQSTDRSNQKSLGMLYPAKKTKPRSPALTGQLRLQPHTLQALIADLENSDSDEVVCNIAAWSNFDKRGRQICDCGAFPKLQAPHRKTQRQYF